MGNIRLKCVMVSIPVSCQGVVVVKPVDVDFALKKQAIGISSSARVNKQVEVISHEEKLLDRRARLPTNPILENVPCPAHPTPITTQPSSSSPEVNKSRS